jgi:hypothetical protein
MTEKHVALILGTVAIFAIFIGFSIYTVNHEDTLKMDIAAKNNMIECREGSFVLWKHSCDARIDN